MARIGILKNIFHPSGWSNCDWTNRMIETIQSKGHEVHLISNPAEIDKETVFYLTRLNHDAGEKNSSMLSKKLDNIAMEFEKRGSTLIPCSYWYRLYENKKNIFYLFEKCGIKKPKTYLFSSYEEALSEILTFPVVLKHPYSCASNYMSQAYDKDQYELEVKKMLSKTPEFLVQEKINFTKEARVTYVGDKAIHGYYRIKKSCDSLSASTRFGSVCDFNIDLEKMSKYIKNFRKLTNINIGAVDIVWEDNKEETEPYFFEVSPIFSMNVPGPIGSEYKKFKSTKEFKIKEREIQNKYYSEVIDFMLNENKKPIIYCDIDETINYHAERVRKWTKNNIIHPNCGNYEEIMKDKPVLEARDILNSAKEKYKIVFITARKKFPNAYLSTRDWLVKNNFHYDNVIITKNFEEKLEIMKKNRNTHLFIDDLTRGYHTGTLEIKKDSIKKLLYNNIPFVRYQNNWEEIKEML